MSADAVERGGLLRAWLLLGLWTLLIGIGLDAWLTAHTPESVPAGWSLEQARVPVKLSDLGGGIPPRSTALSLEHFEALQWQSPGQAIGSYLLTLTVLMPTQGELEIRADGHRAGALPVLGAAPPRTSVSVVLDSARSIRSGLYVDLHSDPAASRRFGQPGSQTRAPISYQSEAAPRTLALSSTGGNVKLELDGAPVADLFAPHTLHALRIGAGLRRIQIQELQLEVDGRVVTWGSLRRPWRRPIPLAALSLLLLVVIVGLSGIEARASIRAGVSRESAWIRSALTWSPCLCFVLSGSERLNTTVAALRLAGLESSDVLLTTVVLSTTLLKTAHWLALPGVGHPGSLHPKDETPSPVPAGEALEPPTDPSILRADRVRVRWALGAILTQGLAMTLLAGGPAAVGLPLMVLAIASLWAVYTRWPRGAAERWLRVERLIALTLLAFVGARLGMLSLESGLQAVLTRPDVRWLPLALAALMANLIIRFLLINLNALQLRAPNLLSLIAILCMGTCAEWMLRSTPLQQSLSAEMDLEILNQFNAVVRDREFRAWPDKFFPVAFEARDSRVPLRVVALGSSSTAGAYQMRDLKLFYPARLQAALRERPGLERAEVINQGVGGWNSLLMRHYIEEMMSALAPDLITFYVGHNDVLTRSTLPYRVYWDDFMHGAAADASGSDARPHVSALLNRLRLYSLLKQGLLHWRYGEGSSAVPVEHARDNLRSVIQAARAQRIRVLLMSEALNPSLEPLLPYFRMLQGLAAEFPQSVTYLGTAEALDVHPQKNTLFLDDCHLTEQGHQVIADKMLEYFDDKIMTGIGNQME